MKSVLNKQKKHSVCNIQKYRLSAWNQRRVYNKIYDFKIIGPFKWRIYYKLKSEFIIEIRKSNFSQ